MMTLESKLDATIQSPHRTDLPKISCSTCTSSKHRGVLLDDRTPDALRCVQKSPESTIQVGHAQLIKSLVLWVTKNSYLPLLYFPTTHLLEGRLNCGNIKDTQELAVLARLKKTAGYNSI